MTIIHDAYKLMLLDSVQKSESLRNKLSFKEHIELCDHIDSLSLSECRQIFQEVEADSVKDVARFTAKYGLAIAAGGLVSGLLAGIALSIGVEQIIGYIFNRTSDRCWKACVQKGVQYKTLCKWTCHVEGCNSVIRDITNQMAKCKATKNPERCLRSLEKQKIKWLKKKEDYIEKQHEEQDKLTKKKAKKRAKIEKKKRKVAAKILKQKEKQSKAREDLVNIVINSNILKENTTFQEQMDILNWVWNAPNYKILNITEESDGPKPPPIPDPKVRKGMQVGLAVASSIVPGGYLAKKVAKYLLKTYDHKCQRRCYDDDNVDNKTLCYRKCKYESISSVSKAIQSEYNKCNNTQQPIKCRKHLRSMMKDYKNKEYVAKMRFDRAMRKQQMER